MRYRHLSTETLERKLELKVSIYMLSKWESTRIEIEAMQAEIERRNQLSWWENIKEVFRYRRV